jgi:hypothetical protein
MTPRDDKLRALGSRLATLYGPGDMLVWLFTAQPLLDHWAPAALIQQRRLSEICRLLDQIDQGVHI